MRVYTNTYTFGNHPPLAFFRSGRYYRVARAQIHAGGKVTLDVTPVAMNGRKLLVWDTLKLPDRWRPLSFLISLHIWTLCHGNFGVPI